MSGLEQDQTGICFKDSRFLEVRGLNKDNVLEYFGLSGFYDRYLLKIVYLISRTCNNEQIKMQRLDPEKIKLLKGIEYEVIRAVVSTRRHCFESQLGATRVVCNKKTKTRKSKGTCNKFLIQEYVY
jgi:hypothetical protein